MEYTKILKQAFQNTKKNKAMWFLALFIIAGGGGGNISFPDTTGFEDFGDEFSGYEAQALSEPVPFDEAIVEEGSDYDYGYEYDDYYDEYYAQDLDEFEQFELMLQNAFVDYWWVWLIVGLLFLALMLFHMVMHFIAIGGLYYGAEQTRQDKPAKFMEMVKYGAGYFWKLFGVNLLVWVVSVVGFLTLMVPFIGILLIDESLWWVGLLYFVPLVLLSIPVFAVLGIIMIYTHQYIALRNRGTVQAFKDGWKLFRANMGSSILFLVIVIGLELALAIIMFVALLLISIPFVIIGFAGYGVSESFVPVIITIALGVLVYIVLAMAVKGLKVSYQYHMWHLVFAEIESSVKLDSVVSEQAKEQEIQQETTQGVELVRYMGMHKRAYVPV